MDLRDIDLNILHIFEAIYTTGNITRAARQLGMNQPTVSNALGRLRDQFKDPLFQRVDKGVAPTPFAESLIDPVRRSLAILRDGISLNRDFDVSQAVRTFRLALNDFAVVSLIPGLLEDISKRSTGLKLYVMGQEVMQPLEALLAGEADIAVDSIMREVPGVDLMPLHVPLAVIVARRGHPQIQGTITKQQYCDAAHIVLKQDSRLRAHAEAVLLSQGITRRVVCEVSNCIQIPSLIASSDLIAMLPGPYARTAAQHYDLQVLPTPFESSGHRIQIATLAEKATDPGIDWLRQHLYRAALNAASSESWLSQPG
ncbi:LysR family transcriptional regulator [Pleomorphomonas sp. JP5]|uniref:LysR family transcriptional regulator n=1 Tax=Pleomorphomonas sp. JP5 TaxID=2942998 RepID=UPI002043A3A8|nr:LysR family transcriptional regulator [Pleomorphomonas sp. JP5]MCM5557820.1 LysR family transcriptional regulator [Pleomorphomonas sp. JP5]